MHKVSQIWDQIQAALFPRLEETFGERLTEKTRQVIAILEVARIEESVPSRWANRMGRPRKCRRALARAFVAKAVYDLPGTKHLIDMLHNQSVLRRICGFESSGDIPDEATFSRAFAEFAKSNLADKVHEALVKEHLGNQIIGHISRDSTAVRAREKPVKREKVEKKPCKRGRPRQGEVREPKTPTRLERQLDQTPEDALREIPDRCDTGKKRDAKGNAHKWIGYKAHIDFADGGLPVTVVTTAASVHDSQVAIPMSRITAGRVTALYELMDSAYDAEHIRSTVADLGHVAIIDRNRRGNETAIGFDPAEKRRYAERSTAERGNSRLKDEFGLRHVRVRGHAKVHAHIMFGIIALFADQLLKMVT